MPAHRRPRQWTHWVTLFALVWATLAPGAARAWAHWQGEVSTEWGQLCSAMNNAASDEVPASGPAGTSAHEHCSLCLLPTDQVAPPALLQTATLRTDLGHAQPLLFLQAPHTLHAWSAALARAPPSLV